MPELRIRPSTKLIKARYALALILIVAIAVFWYLYPHPAWLAALLIPLILLITTVIKHIRRRFVTMDIVGDRMKYSAGMTSKVERSIPLAKVQDVTVTQTLGQRILGLGDLSIETAGDSSRLTMEEIDSPRVVADQILQKVASLNSNQK